MAPEIKEALCGLCRSFWWSYGVCWRFDRRDPRLLVIGDSYYEEEIGTAIDKTITYLHLVGQGTIGAAAVSGRHQWIHSDTSLEGNAEWQHQFLAGMKTIVIIPLPSFGVVQFGSTKKICENSAFLNQVQQLFCQHEDLMGNSIPRHTYANLDVRDPCETFASSIYSAQSYASNKSIDSFHDVIAKELQDNPELSTNHILSSDHFALGSCSGILSESVGINPHLSAFPINPSRAGASVSQSNPFPKTPITSSITSFQGTRQCLESSAETQVLVLPNKNTQASYGFPGDTFTSNLNVNTWAKEIASLPWVSTGSPPFTSHMNPFQNHCGSSNSSHGIRGSRVSIHGSGKLVDPSSSSSPSKSSTKSPSIASEASDIFLSFPQDSFPGHSACFQFKDDQTDNQIDPCDQPSVHVTDNMNLSTNENITSVEEEDIGCSPSTDVPSKPVENYEDTGCDGNSSTSDRPVQLVLDNDLFEGIDLDLSPQIPRQGSWEDILLPVGSSGCSNLSTSVSDCVSEMEMGTFSAANKGLFPGPIFEQLLDAVVGQSANLLSNHSSIPLDISSIGSLEFDHRPSTTKRADCPQAGTKMSPSAEFSFEEIIQQSSDEALLKSDVSSWIDDSCIRNAENIATKQPKKLEQTAKAVRKRARPGESTRPRPKDRQQIQDRLKELREIVPNGAKCSIDALLDRTIKHMLFMQSVAKYADRLKQSDEPKMIGDESGVVLKDNPGSGAGCGGATWAYEVAGQTMVCPILVEDINPPGQMLVEMLCEERGFFLEIAGIIRGFGLTILKGVMEIRENKIWSRFLVEANRDVTRMDIFLSLVQLLQQTSSIRTSEQQAKSLDKGVADAFTTSHQPRAPIPISLAERLP